MSTDETTVAYTRSFSEFNVTVAEHGVALRECVQCGKVQSGDSQPKKCGRCRAAVYCDKECQSKDWTEGGHKRRCKIIKEKQASLEHRAHELHSMEDWMGETTNFFNQIGYFWGLIETRDYCRQRFGVMDALLNEAKARMNPNENTKSSSFVNRLALEMALEHALDLLTANTSDNQGIRYYVPCMMIGLGKYQEAYDFLKYWMVVQRSDEDSDEDDDGHGNRDVAAAPAFLRTRGEDISEPLEKFDLHKFSPTTMVLDLSLVKICLYQSIRNVQTLESGVIQNADNTKMVGNMAEIPNRWLELDANRILTQSKEVLSCVHEINKHILPGFVRPGQLLRMDPDYYSSGSREEAALILKRSYDWWKHNKFAIQFITNFVNNVDKGSLLPVPRNEAKRRKREEESARFQAMRNDQDPSTLFGLINHFERVKSTAPVRELLASIGLPHLSSEGRFPGTMIICSALVRAGADSDENLRLLFGSSDSRMVLESMQGARFYAGNAEPGSPAASAGFTF